MRSPKGAVHMTAGTSTTYSLTGAIYSISRAGALQVCCCSILFRWRGRHIVNHQRRRIVVTASSSRRGRRRSEHWCRRFVGNCCAATSAGTTCSVFCFSLLSTLRSCGIALITYAICVPLWSRPACAQPRRAGQTRPCRSKGC